MFQTKITAGIIFLTLTLAFILQAQNTSGLRSIQPDNAAEIRLNQITSDAERYYKQGNLNLNEGRLPQALADFDKAVEVILMSGVNVRASKKLNDYYFQLIDRINQMEMNAKKKSTQISKLSNEISPRCGVSALGSELLINVTEELIQAINNYKNKKDDEALTKLRIVLANEPMNAMAYLLLGKIHLRRGDIEQAVSSLKTSLFWDDRIVEAYILLGKILYEKNDLIQAQNYSQSALELEPENNRVQILSRLVEKRETANDKRDIEDDSKTIEKLIQELNQSASVIIKKYPNLLLVAPFQSRNVFDLLGEDFAHVLSEILVAPNLCVIGNEDREKIFESFGFVTGETFTLATAIKLAMASESNLLVVGQYNKAGDTLNATTKLIKVNEGRYHNETLPEGRKITRDVIASDAFSNLRIIQGQIAYQLLYQYDKTIPFSQNMLIEKALKIKLPSQLIVDNNSTSQPDFSVSNSLRKTICSDEAIGNLQLRGFRLGMTIDEVMKAVPKTVVKLLSSYEKKISLNITALPKDTRFNNVDSIQLLFFDNYLYSIGIIYDGSIKWLDLDEFVSQTEKSLNLPKMKSGGYEFGGKYLFCGNYQLKAMLTSSKIPAIHLFDTTIHNKILQRKQEERKNALQKKIEEEKRKQKIEEEKKKVFKP